MIIEILEKEKKSLKHKLDAGQKTVDNHLEKIHTLTDEGFKTIKKRFERDRKNYTMFCFEYGELLEANIIK